MRLKLVRIISGGQTGADQGGLEAAVRLGIPTGGKVPLGFKTENGAMPELGELYGLEELMTPEYPPRTRYNVVDSDGTIIFGRTSETGSWLTRSMCLEGGRPCLWIEDFSEAEKLKIVEFISKFKIRTLNIAGNRESKYPGLQQKVSDFLVDSLKAFYAGS